MSSFVFLAILAVACGYALRRGGKPERTVALVFIAAWLVSLWVDLPFTFRYYSVAVGIAAIDTAMLLVLGAVSLRSDRYWPMLMTSLQLVILLTHLVRWIEPSYIRRAYWMLTTLPAYLQILTLAVATWRHHGRVMQTQSGEFWRRSLRQIFVPNDGRHD